MPKIHGTAREFILQTLNAYPDRELQVADLHDWCEGKFTKENIGNALAKLLVEGKVVKNVDGRSVWWAVNVEPTAPSSPAA